FRLDLDGWDYNPSVICFANATSLYTREAALRVACNPSSVFFGKAEKSTFPSGKAIPPCVFNFQLSTLH
ncbi:MAG: hypothetical protein IJE28_10700, partial [Oscillospiraceae bacterium]|nr:hypothetical protein [Oscillospiraceae bacterium]